jgi:hypothetical protein
VNRRDLLQKLSGALAVAGVVAVTVPKKLLAACNTQTQDFQGSNVLINLCTGELMSLQYNAHAVTSSCVKKDGTTSFRVHIEFHETGVGLTSGTRYVFNQQTFEKVVDPPGCPFSESETTRVVAVSQGSAPNEQILIKFDLSVDANCQLTVGPPIFDVDCHG